MITVLVNIENEETAKKKNQNTNHAKKHNNIAVDEVFFAQPYANIINRHKHAFM